MSTASGFPGFASEHRTSLVVSALLHGALLLAFSSSLILVPKMPLQLTIEAVVIDESQLQKPVEREKPKVDE